MSTKTKKPATENFSVAIGPEPVSMSDAGYKAAKTGDSAIAIARWIFGQCPSILDEVPKEIKTGLYAGFQTRKHEITPPQYYRLADGGTYIPAKEGEGEGIVCMTINSAMSYSAQEFGKMRESDPAKHAIVKPMRDAFSSYASNNMAALLSHIRRIAAAGQPRQRAANKGFAEAAKTVFDTLDKRVRTAKDRGDLTADPVKFRVAVDAFWKAYNAE